jgi:hypothetical protein
VAGAYSLADMSGSQTETMEKLAFETADVPSAADRCDGRSAAGAVRDSNRAENRLEEREYEPTTAETEASRWIQTRQSASLQTGAFCCSSVGSVDACGPLLTHCISFRPARGAIFCTESSLRGSNPSECAVRVEAAM